MAEKKRKRYQSELDAIDRYNERTYHLIAIKLRKEDDEDIIKDFLDAKERGIKSRDWLRTMYEVYKTDKK